MKDLTPFDDWLISSNSSCSSARIFCVKVLIYHLHLALHLHSKRHLHQVETTCVVIDTWATIVCEFSSLITHSSYVNSTIYPDVISFPTISRLWAKCSTNWTSFKLVIFPLLNQRETLPIPSTWRALPSPSLIECFEVASMLWNSILFLNMWLEHQLSISQVPPFSFISSTAAMNVTSSSSSSFVSFTTFAFLFLYQHWALTCPYFLHT